MIAEKFKSNPALFVEFKRLLSQKKEVASNKLWTFPQFKVQEHSQVGRDEIMFPDPKYYMVGFTCCPPEERRAIQRPATDQKGTLKE